MFALVVRLVVDFERLLWDVIAKLLEVLHLLEQAY